MYVFIYLILTYFLVPQQQPCPIREIDIANSKRIIKLDYQPMSFSHGTAHADNGHIYHITSDITFNPDNKPESCMRAITYEREPGQGEICTFQYFAIYCITDSKLDKKFEIEGDMLTVNLKDATSIEILVEKECNGNHSKKIVRLTWLPKENRYYERGEEIQLDDHPIGEQDDE